MSKKTLRAQAGITILEILIGLLLIGVVGSLIIAIYSTQLRVFLTQISGIDIASKNKIALNELTNQTRQAESIVSTCPSGGCTGDTTGSSVVVFRVWALDSTGDPTSSAYDYIVLRQDPSATSKLIRKVLPDATSTRAAAVDIIATNLTSNGLSISYNNADPTLATKLTFTITTTTSEGGKTQTSTHTATASLRNSPQ